MTIPNANSRDNLETEMTADQLIIALHDMRDELLKTSQMVKKYSFHVNSVLTSGAIKNVNELLEKYKFR